MIEKVNLTEKHLPIDSELGWFKPFEAMGKRYEPRTYINYMPPKRYIAWQKWGIISATGRSFQEHHEDLIDLQNTHVQTFSDISKLYDVSIKIESMKNSIVNFGDKRFYGSYMVACIFFIREGENEMEWNEDLQEVKINELIEEGFDGRDFFQFAPSTISGFTSAYNSLTQA